MQNTKSKNMHIGFRITRRNKSKRFAPAMKHAIFEQIADVLIFMFRIAVFSDSGVE